MKTKPALQPLDVRGPSEPPRSAAVLPKPDSFRDTIESIVIAFIFAFVFRAFVVEAFVIPTGSMAPTLYGKHGQHVCASCRYPFAFGIRDRTRVGDQDLAGTLDNGGRVHVRCPNCDYDGPGNDDLNSVSYPVDPRSGDRILVLKWPYDIGGELLGPKRWDVVVFKDPQDGEQNFIKRLLGLPGEVLEIIDGDIYAAPIASLSPGLREQLTAHLPTAAGAEHRARPPLDLEALRELDGKLRVCRKTRVAQDSLWMLHYDHDYPPNFGLTERYPKYDPPRWAPRTAAASGVSPWDARTPRIRFDSGSDAGEHWLALEGKPIQDGYGYNLATTAGNGQDVFVGDVRLRFELFPRGGDGRLTIVLKRGDDAFRVRIQADGTVTLERIDHDGIPRTLAGGRLPEPLTPREAVTVDVQNVDYRVALYVDGREIVATTDKQYRPDLTRLRRRDDGAADPAAIEIGAERLKFELRHVQVFRDVFYRSDARLDHTPVGNRSGWGTTNNPILLRDDPAEYFCCGDNSPQSKDSRLWTTVCPMLQRRGNYQPGTVPADQMIGRAFFVYWPAGHRITGRTPALIPNMGRMRMIR